MPAPDTKKRALAELSVIAATRLEPAVRESLRSALGAGATAEEALSLLLGEEAEADVGSVGELSPGKVRAAHAFGRRLAVGNVDGAWFAIDAACPHANGPLDLGELKGTTLSCPIHGFEFDVRTGACLTDPGSSVECFRVETKGERLVVRRK